MYSLYCWLALLTAEVDQQFINIKYVRAAGEFYELDRTFSFIFISALIRNTIITKKKNVCSIPKFYRQSKWQWYIGPGRINIINVILFIRFFELWFSVYIHVSEVQTYLQDLDIEFIGLWKARNTHRTDFLGVATNWWSVDPINPVV
jgi:hypothetical protein